MNELAELVALLFLSRELAHREHLKVTGPGSYAKHVALNEFYDGIVPLADRLVEVYQGRFEIIEDIPLAENEYEGDITSVLEQQLDWIDANRDKVTDYRPLQNIIDEVCSLYCATLYKLKNLS